MTSFELQLVRSHRPLYGTGQLCKLHAMRMAPVQGPIDGLKFHLADPWKNNFATNGVSIPFLGYP